MGEKGWERKSHPFRIIISFVIRINMKLKILRGSDPHVQFPAPRYFLTPVFQRKIAETEK